MRYSYSLHVMWNKCVILLNYYLHIQLEHTSFWTSFNALLKILGDDKVAVL